LVGPKLVYAEAIHSVHGGISCAPQHHSFRRQFLMQVWLTVWLIVWKTLTRSLWQIVRSMLLWI